MPLNFAVPTTTLPEEAVSPDVGNIAETDANGKIFVPATKTEPSKYRKARKFQIDTFANFADLPSDIIQGDMCFCIDASGDPAISSGWALYEYFDPDLATNIDGGTDEAAGWVIILTPSSGGSDTRRPYGLHETFLSDTTTEFEVGDYIDVKNPSYAYFCTAAGTGFAAATFVEIREDTAFQGVSEVDNISAIDGYGRGLNYHLRLTGSSAATVSIPAATFNGGSLSALTVGSVLKVDINNQSGASRDIQFDPSYLKSDGSAVGTVTMADNDEKVYEFIMDTRTGSRALSLVEEGSGGGLAMYETVSDRNADTPADGDISFVKALGAHSEGLANSWLPSTKPNGVLARVTSGTTVSDATLTPNLNEGFAWKVATAAGGTLNINAPLGASTGDLFRIELANDTVAAPTDFVFNTIYKDCSGNDIGTINVAQNEQRIFYFVADDGSPNPGSYRAINFDVAGGSSGPFDEVKSSGAITPVNDDRGDFWNLPGGGQVSLSDTTFNDSYFTVRQGAASQFNLSGYGNVLYYALDGSESFPPGTGALPMAAGQTYLVWALGGLPGGDLVIVEREKAADAGLTIDTAGGIGAPVIGTHQIKAASGGGHVISAPDVAGLSAGDSFAITDAGSSFGTDNVTVQFGSSPTPSNLHGAADDFVMDVDKAHAEFVYSGDVSIGWIIKKG